MSTCESVRYGFVSAITFIGVVACFCVGVSAVGLIADADKCATYGAVTGREVKFMHAECYVRTGDHFVPRSEYGRQP